MLENVNIFWLIVIVFLISFGIFSLIMFFIYVISYQYNAIEAKRKRKKEEQQESMAYYVLDKFINEDYFIKRLSGKLKELKSEDNE